MTDLLAPVIGRERETLTLPNSENECQQSIGHDYHRILDNVYSNWMQLSIDQILEAFTRKNDCDILSAAFWESASMQGQGLFSFISWVIYVLIGFRHPFIRYWWPLLASPKVTCPLPHPENVHQLSVNSVSCCIFGKQGIGQIFAFVTALLTTPMGTHTIYQRYETGSKLIDIASFKASTNKPLVVENPILIRYYYQTPKTRALYESMHGPAGWSTNSAPKWERLGVDNQTVLELTVRIYWQPGRPMQ